MCRWLPTFGLRVAMMINAAAVLHTPCRGCSSSSPRYSRAQNRASRSPRVGIATAGAAAAVAADVFVVKLHRRCAAAASAVAVATTMRTIQIDHGSRRHCAQHWRRSRTIYSISSSLRAVKSRVTGIVGAAAAGAAATGVAATAVVRWRARGSASGSTRKCGAVVHRRHHPRRHHLQGRIRVVAVSAMCMWAHAPPPSLTATANAKGPKGRVGPVHWHPKASHHPSSAAAVARHAVVAVAGPRATW